MTTTGVAAGLANKYPLLTAHGGRLVPRKAPIGRRVAITFDDGPDEKWTPRIARALRALDAPATFFVLGSKVVRHPGIVRDLAREGFELGNHTFNHAELASSPRWQRTLQIRATENAIAGATGHGTRLLRPPYSSTPDALTTKAASLLAQTAQSRYALVLSNLDGRDWDERKSIQGIVRSAMPPGPSGGVLLLHDGGGNRSRTLRALPLIVRELRARGFRLTTVSNLLGLPARAVQPRAGRWQRICGRLLAGTLSVAQWVERTITALLVPIALLMIARGLVAVTLARRHARRRALVPSMTSYAPPVSIIVPAFNEAVGIERAVKSLAESDYPEFEVLVVDDGSSDGTGELVKALELTRVKVIRQENAGKAAALHRGVGTARHEIVVMVDADTVFEPDSLRLLVAPLSAPAVGAVSGNTKVGNRRRLLGRWQHVEYVMGFNLDRRLYDVLRCMPTVPGAIGAFRRQAVAEVGGISSDTLAEDTDLTIALGRAGWEVVYAEEARAWTEAPSTLSGLWRQRYRWSYGTMQAVWKHRAAIWRRGEERIGRRGLPYLVLFQLLLPALAPLIDLFAVYGLVFLDPGPVLAYWLGFNLMQLTLAAYAFRLDGESLGPLWSVPIQQFAYRQLMYLVVIESLMAALRGTRLGWQHVERTGTVEVGSARRALAADARHSPPASD